MLWNLNEEILKPLKDKEMFRSVPNLKDILSMFIHLGLAKILYLLFLVRTLKIPPSFLTILTLRLFASTFATFFGKCLHGIIAYKNYTNKWYPNIKIINTFPHNKKDIIIYTSNFNYLNDIRLPCASPPLAWDDFVAESSSQVVPISKLTFSFSVDQLLSVFFALILITF